MSIAECLDIDPETVASLQLVLEAFALTVPELVSLDFAVKIPDLPGSAIELFLGNLSPELPSFSANIPGIGTIEFTGGVDLNTGLEIPVFDPGSLDAGLISFIVGLSTILIKLPEIFIDLGPPPVLKTPKLPDDIVNLVSVSLGLPGEPTISTDFKIKLTQCIVDSILVVLP